MSAKVTLVVQGTSMQLGHEGLAKLLKKDANVDITKLEPGSLIMCLNTAGDKLKVIGAFGMVIGYLKMPKGQKIYKEAFQYLPQCFGATGFDYTKAVRLALEKRLFPVKKVPLKASHFKALEQRA